jgi:hypothetical protein
MANQYLQPVITIPSALEISSISQAQQMVVTVSANSDQMNAYIPGQKVRLTVPQSFGMYQANGLVGSIVSIGDSALTLAIDSSGFDPFVLVAGQVASIAPSGSQNLTLNNMTTQVPFHNLNKGN